MTRRQRDKVVEALADLTLAEEPSLKAYAAYFEAQMHRGKAHRLLYAGYRWLTRARRLLARVPHGRNAFTRRRPA